MSGCPSDDDLRQYLLQQHAMLSEWEIDFLAGLSAYPWWTPNQSLVVDQICQKVDHPRRNAEDKLRRRRESEAAVAANRESMRGASHLEESSDLVK